jgi:hypothetical protein
MPIQYYVGKLKTRDELSFYVSCSPECGPLLGLKEYRDPLSNGLKCGQLKRLLRMVRHLNIKYAASYPTVEI